MNKPTQLQMYYTAQRKAADMDHTWMEIMKDPPTKSEFDSLLSKRPEVYSRYTKFRNQLPDSR